MAKSSHILHLCSWYPNRILPTNGNFIKKHIAVIPSCFRKSVLHVKTDPGVTSIEIVENKISDTFLEVIIYVPYTSFSFIKLCSFYKGYLKGFKLIKKKQGPISLYHIHVASWIGIWALFSSIFKNKKYIVSEHSSKYLQTKKRNTISTYFSCLLFNKSAIVLPVSQTLSDGLTSFGVTVSKRKIIGNVVDFNTFSIQSKNVVPLKKQFIHISTGDSKSKNVAGIIEAVYQLSKRRTDFTLKIICDGDITPLHKLARSYQLLDSHVFFSGTCESEEICSALNDSIALLMFSNYETFGIVVVEALACGIPVIATDIPAMKELISNSTGILVNPKDTIGLVSAMEKTLNQSPYFEPQLLRESVMNKFDCSIIGAKFNDIYTELIHH